jgi:FkbM family methyltransferase
MSNAGQWAQPVLDSVRKYLPSAPTVETPADLAKAVEKAIGQAIQQERGQMWAGLLGKEVLFPHHSGVSFWVRLGDGISMYAIRSEKDDAATRFLLARLSKGGTFLDVGANTGWFALRAAARYREIGGGSVHAFEPQPVMFDLITRSIRQNELENILTLHGIALGNEQKTVWMATPAFNSGGSTVRFREVNESVPVQMTTLDSVDIRADRIDVMKVDIEGAEPLFIEGAVEFLKEHRPVIYSELHPKKLEWVSKRTREDYLDQVEALGYRTLALTRDGSTAPFDRAELQNKSKLIDVVFEPNV